MGTSSKSFEIPDEMMSKIQQARRYGESRSDVVERIVSRGIRGDINRTKLKWVSFIAAILWLISLGFVNTTVASLVGAFHIITILFWVIWLEIQ